MNRSISLLFLLVFLGFSCQQGPVIVSIEHWDEVPNLSLNSTINDLHATSDELLIATTDNFARMTLNETIVERRNLEVQKGVFGRPIVADHLFARVLKNIDNDRELQFHLVSSINQIYRITDVEMADSAEFILLEELPNAVATGAFNDEGTQFCYATRSLNPQGQNYSFFFFDIELNAAKNQFQNVSIAHRVDIPQTLMGAEAGILSNVKCFGGNFYITTLNGAFKIQPDGEWQQIFAHWTWDVFENEDKLYVTGFYENEFYSSEDNGDNWEFINNNTPLKRVKVTGEKVFGQNQLGLPYSLATPDLTTLQEISYNSNFFEDEPTAYQAIEYFNGKYYVSVHKRMFAAEDIVLK